MGVRIAALKRCATQDQQRQNRPVRSTVQNQQRKINRAKSEAQKQGQSQPANYGLVLAISGMASSFSFLGGPPKWYSVRPSRRKAKASSGESTNLNRLRSSGATVPASTKAWKFMMRCQYSLP